MPRSASAAQPAAGEAGGKDLSGGGAQGAPPANPSPQPGLGGGQIAAVDDAKIIRTGTMSLEVSDVGNALRVARDAIVGLGGYVGASTTSNDGEQPSAEITYRIPADKWEAALDSLRGLNGLTTKVVTEHTEAVEVTSQVIDLEARIANLRASEVALQGIAAKAIKISDVLEVQAQLTETRGQIETLTAQLKDLNDRAGYAHAGRPVQRPDPRRRGGAAGLGPDHRGRRSVGEHGLGPPGPGDRRDLVRHRVAADPAGRRSRDGHRGRDRATARLWPADARRPAAGTDRRRGPGLRREDPAPWHHAAVTDQTERFDRFSAGYARWWAPVLAPAVAELLDAAEPSLAGGERLIDIGTGTGQLALGAIARWPGVSVVGADASAGMAGVADAEADRLLSGADRGRFRSVVAFADALPFGDGEFDGALSSFVFQLVPNRARALREARRVLKPGATLAYVSWLEDDRLFAPDATFDDVLDEFDFEERAGDGRSGDIPSVERAAGELRRAGFSDVTARRGMLEHRFSVEGYIAFLVEFDEETLFAELEPDLRERLIATLRERLTALSADQMTMRFPIVFASGRRSRA